MNQGDINPQDPQAIAHMCDVLGKLYDPDRDTRVAAEREIKNIGQLAARQCGYCQLLLNIAYSSQVPPDVQQSAAVVLMRFIRSSWDPAQSEQVIVEQEKAAIRHQIFQVMLYAPPHSERILADCVQLISATDFPKQWPELLNSLVSSLQSGTSMTAMNGALKIAASVFQRYRDESEMTEELKEELLEINRVFTGPLLNALGQLTQLLYQTGQQTQQTKDIVLSLTSACSCYSDLTSLDMGQEHEDSLTSIMTALRSALQFRNADLMGGVFDQGPLVKLHATVLECITVHLQKYDEEFSPFVQTFAQDVWNLLQAPEAQRPACDDLVISCMEFLSTVARSGHHTILTASGMLQLLTEQVIIPNLHLRDDLEIEMFEDEPEQYIQREIDGSDVHTRRRGALEMVRALLIRFEAQVNPIFQSSCMSLLQGDWKSKDAAIYFITAMAVKGTNTSQREAMELNPAVPIAQFFTSTIMPELGSHTIPSNSHEILKADAIRFVATFRQFLDPATFGQLLVQLAGWLTAESIVVQTYAAHAIEKLLLVKEQGALRVTPEVFAPAAPHVLQNLCTKLLSTSKPNEYLMRCLMTLEKHHEKPVLDSIGPLVNSLTQMLEVQVKNPSNPMYNHCLWECISHALKYAPNFVVEIEGLLWPHLMRIFQDDTVAFLPYALQIISQLIHARSLLPSPDYATYLQMYPELVKPSMFEMKGNIPAVAKLLATFNRVACEQLEAMGMTMKTLGVYQQLLSLKQFDHEGFNVFGSLVMHCPGAIIDKHMPTALQIILNRQQSAPTPKFTRCEVFFFALLAAHRGAQYFTSLTESIQPGLTKLLLSKVWFPHVQKVAGVTERKISVVALSNLLTESPTVLNDPALMTQCLTAVVKLIHLEQEKDDHKSFMSHQVGLSDLSAVSTDVDNVGFNNIYCPLQGAQLPPEDPVPSVTDPNQYFIRSCQAMLGGPHGAALRTATASLPQEMQHCVPR